MPAFSAHLALLVLASTLGPAAGSVNVLVFGDSQGDTGPTFQVVTDQLKKHDRDGTVKNAAVGGTLSCGWAQDPDAVAKAARKAFGSGGADIVWLTVGGNDLAGDQKYHVGVIPPPSPCFSILTLCYSHT